jgi:hypothetical protein
MFRGLLSGLVIAAFATDVQAAQLSDVHGAVFVDYGEGFQPVAGPALVTAGNRVRTGDGSAQIIYDEGCAVRVGRDQAVLVLAVPPSCSSSTFGGLKDGVIAEGPSTGTLLVVGGLLLAGGTVGVIELVDPKLINPKPASP